MLMQEQIQKLNDEINEKKVHMRVLEQRMLGSFETTAPSSSNIDTVQVILMQACDLLYLLFLLQLNFG